MAKRAALSDEVRAALRPWYSEEVMGAVPVLRGSFFGWLFGLNGNYAVTINGTVHVTKRAAVEGSMNWTVLMGHELFHVEQQAAMGWWRFLARYLWHYRPRHLRSARSHPYEIPAYARGAEIRARLGEG
ncbi:MAG: DUF4157 domain-containing protein [Chloroflexi bacterium]|nr:DUF4157 domain-containing protein [Chloroflexota bacterium]